VRGSRDRRAAVVLHGAACLIGVLFAAGCATGRRPDTTPAASRPPAAAALPPGGIPFEDVTTAAGIRFRHDNGAESPFNILQTAGSGCAFLDYDRDGVLDLFFVSGRPLPWGPGSGFRVVKPEAPAGRTAVLYRGNGDGSFRDVTARSGIRATAYGMGCLAADFDGDGWTDLYVTNFGPNALYRNNRDGTFTEVAARSGVAPGADPELPPGVSKGDWSTAAAAADYDGDGDLDLFVGRYIRFGPEERQYCYGGDVPLSCPPIFYQGQNSYLFRNRGNGRFDDVTRKAGLYDPLGKVLGALWCDDDGDGDPDLYVTHDGLPNAFYRNRGDGNFENAADAVGVALGATGLSEGSMGVDAADYDRDGDFDLFVTNFHKEPNALYRNEGGYFTHRSTAADLAIASLPLVSFGAVVLDYDNDGWDDLFVASGQVQDLIAKIDPLQSYAQPRQLFRNLGNGAFADLTASCGPVLTAPAVGRGVCAGDYDNDGDMDLCVSNNGAPPMLLRNRVGSRNAWVRLRLAGRPPNPFGIGARVTLTPPGGMSGPAGRRVAEVRAGAGYLSGHDPRLLFGLGGGDALRGTVTVTVRWSRGKTTVHRGIPLRRETILKEP